MLTITIQANDFAQLKQELLTAAKALEAIAAPENQPSGDAEVAVTPVAVAVDAETLSDEEYDAKHDPIKQQEPPPPQTPKRGRPKAAKSNGEDQPAAPAPEPPTTEAMIAAITTNVRLNKPGLKEKVAILRPKLGVAYIAECNEAHRAALWEFIQEAGIEIL